MPKIFILALVGCALLAGCQSNTETEDKPVAPSAAAETPAAAPEVQADAAVPEALPPAESAGEADSELRTGLAHHNFVLETVDGREFTYPVPEGAAAAQPNLSFGQWPHASGKICNGFSGQVELDGDTLFLKNAASTMMLCFADELNKFEGLFHQLLSGGVKVTLDGRTLTLTGGGHVLVFKLRDYVS